VGAHPTGYDRILGFALELVPEVNPYALGSGGSLPVRLLQGGKPLAGALITAVPREHADRKVGSRTDTHGRARIELATSGVWLLKAVWVRPLAGKYGEWESRWASLTFELP
jgi:uncharacterized GH25 family protein